MKRIIVARPDYSISLPLYVLFILGGIGIVSGAILFFAGFLSLCQILPVLSVSVALLAILPWSLRHLPFAAGRRASRTALSWIVLAVFLAVASIWCWLRYTSP